jgi:hypothetical protein
MDEENREPRAGVSGGGELARIRGSRIANGFARRRVRQPKPVHENEDKSLLSRQEMKWCHYFALAAGQNSKKLEYGRDEAVGFCFSIWKTSCLGEPHVTSAAPGGSPVLPPVNHEIL